MVIDHIGEYFLNDNLWCRLIGRGAAPLFFFLIGYVNKLRIRPTLILYGCILTATGYYVLHQFLINILLSFILIQWVLHIFPIQSLNTWVRFFAFILCALLNLLLYQYIEYGSLGLLIAYCGRLIGEKDPEADYWLLLCLLLYFLWESLYFAFTQYTYYLYAFAFLTACLFFIMRSYRLQGIPCPLFLRFPALIISRFSLEFYFLHLIVIQAFYYLYFRPLLF